MNTKKTFVELAIYLNYILKVFHYLFLFYILSMTLKVCVKLKLRKQYYGIL